MTWRSFVDYVLMCELGQADAIARNYDLDDLNGVRNAGIVFDRGALRMGLDQRNIVRHHLPPMIAQRLRDMGYIPPDADTIMRLVRQWYVWDRIRKGEVRQWPLKPRDDNPLF